MKRFTGQAEVTLAGQKFTLRLGIREIEAIECDLDVGIGEVATRFARAIQAKDPRLARVRDARCVVRYGFSGAKLQITDERFDDLTMDAGFDIIQAASLLLFDVLAGDDEGNAPAAADGKAGEPTAASP